MLIANAYRKCLLQLCNTSQRISTEIRRRKITDRTIVRQLHITSKNQFHNFLLLFDNSNMIHTPTCYHQLRARTVIPLCITIIVKLLVFHTNVLLKNCKYIAKTIAFDGCIRSKKADEGSHVVQKMRVSENAYA